MSDWRETTLGMLVGALECVDRDAVHERRKGDLLDFVYPHGILDTMAVSGARLETKEHTMASTGWLVRLTTGFCAIMALALPALAPAQTNAVANSGYSLGIFPYLSPRQTVDLYAPAANSISRALGVPIKLESAGSFTDFLKGITDQHYDIALMQPFDYIEAVEKQGYIPLARLAEPLVTQFFVRADSRYQKLEDLRGTTIAMPPAAAAASRMALRALYENKLVPGRDLEARHFNSHDSCLQQVWVGSASACASAQPPVLIFEQRMHAKLRPIYDTPPIPHIVFVAHPRVPAADRAKLASTIVGWTQTDEGRALLKGLGFPGFAPVQPGEYELMHGYDPLAPSHSAAPYAMAKPISDLVLGVFPYLTPRQLIDVFAPALPALSKAAAVTVRLRTAANYGRFSDALESGTFDVALVQPFDFAKATGAGYLPLARMKEHLEGVFFVLDSSPYRQIVDFKGKVVAMPPAASALGRLGRHALQKAGLEPGLNVTIDHRATHDSCLQQTKLGAAAACVTIAKTLNVVPAELGSGLRAVGQTENIPGTLFMAHQRLPAAMRARLQAEIVAWPDSADGRRILQTLNFGDYVPVSVADYQHMPVFK